LPVRSRSSPLKLAAKLGVAQIQSFENRTKTVVRTVEFDLRAVPLRPFFDNELQVQVEW